MISLYSTLNGGYVGIESFKDMASLLVFLQKEKNDETADRWEITKEGAPFHYEAFIRGGEIETRRVPPLS